MTLLTVGLGNFPPKTHLGRSLLFPYALSGIIILGTVIGSIRSLIHDAAGARIGVMILKHERKRQVEKFFRPSQLEKPTAAELSEPSGQSLNANYHREQFDLIRKIQRSALLKCRYASLGLSTLTFLTVLLFGAFVFSIAEASQNWTYFDSIYFAYTSILTIGYGDFYPTSNLAKPFFVLWALISVPILTILVGRISEAVTDWVNSTKWTIFRADFRAIPPGLLGESQRLDGEKRPSSRQDGDLEHGEVRETLDTGKGDWMNLTASRNLDIVGLTPWDKGQYHCLLIEEVARVMKDVTSAAPRRYTFEQWVWYLKLIGEESRDMRQHRERRVPCSWLDDERLMLGTGHEEGEWILARLMKTLQRELMEGSVKVLG